VTVGSVVEVETADGHRLRGRVAMTNPDTIILVASCGTFNLRRDRITLLS